MALNPEWRGQPDAELLTLIKNTVANLISTQTPDRCIRSYPAELQINDWDVWGRYVLIGLARYYLKIERSETVKTAMTRELDYLISQVGPDAGNIVKCNWHTGLGTWTQNFFAAITDSESAVAGTRSESRARIMPLDFDRSPKSDLGYSGWVQFAGGEIYVVNYIVDDAYDSAQIRGYSFLPEEFII